MTQFQRSVVKSIFLLILNLHNSRPHSFWQYITKLYKQTKKKAASKSCYFEYINSRGQGTEELDALLFAIFTKISFPLSYGGMLYVFLQICFLNPSKLGIWNWILSTKAINVSISLCSAQISFPSCFLKLKQASQMLLLHFVACQV